MDAHQATDQATRAPEPDTDQARPVRPCPHLEVAPRRINGRYTGAFVARHRPTGRLLFGIAETVEEIELAIQYVSERDLDWSSPDPEFYLRHRFTYQGAWTESVRAAFEYLAWGGEE